LNPSKPASRRTRPPGAEPTEAGQTKRRQLAETLEREIAAGRWPLQGKLPSENELVAHFGVSRQTVRSAISTLQQKGLVATRRGLGTLVLRKHPSPEYSQSLESIPALAYYARHTVVQVVSVEDLELTGDLAATVGARPGSVWTHAQTLRSAVGQKLPVGLSSVWVPAVHRQVIQHLAKTGTPVFLGMQKASKQMVSEVKQVLGASLPTRAQARLLQCQTREAMLRIQRWYYTTDGTLLTMTDTLHPPTRFKYAMTLQHLPRGNGR
jgi:DNA-binding GntR family transcriptional regulator